MDDPKEALDLLLFLHSMYDNNYHKRCMHGKIISENNVCLSCYKCGYNYVIPIDFRYMLLSHALYREKNKLACLFSIKPAVGKYGLTIHIQRRAQIIVKIEKFIETYDKTGEHDMDELINSAKKYIAECKLITPNIPLNRIENIIKKVKSDDMKSNDVEGMLPIN